MNIWPGYPYPLGATFTGSGVNFALFSEVADKVEVCLIADDGTETRVELTEVDGHVWHGYITAIEPGQRYGFRVHGPFDPANGHRCNPAKLLLDPYAKAIDGQIDGDGSLYSYYLGDPAKFNDADSLGHTMLSVVVNPFFDWGHDRPPRHEYHNTVIYEAHVRGLSMTHPDVPESIRGTYAAIGHQAIIEHLTGLGVTAIELMPVHEFVQDATLHDKGLTNYWGYNTIGFLAPHAAYAATGSRGQQVAEFKAMVKALHEANIEVILDVVYNHTAEGNEKGPTIAVRGIDNASYYRLTDGDESLYYDTTGTGNSLLMRHPHVLQLIMDSLRYWVEDMHVDGFRFDLAATLARQFHEVDRLSAFFDIIQQDPVISQVKLIAEPWDLGDELDLGDHRILLDDLEERREPVHLMELAGQGRREVEAEPVNMHLFDPVAQGVHDQLQDVGVAHQQAVAGARGVVVLRLVLVDEAVVGGVVDAPEGDRRALLVALGGVVVDDVEDDLDIGLVQRLHHGLELGHLLTARSRGGVGRMRSEEPDGVVAPVVRQALILQRAVLNELVHRHQLDGRHSQAGEVLDDRLVTDCGIRSANAFGNTGMGHGQALDVSLIDDGVVVLVTRRPVVAPVEERVHYHGQHGVTQRVRLVELRGGAEVVGVQGPVAVDLAVNRLGVRVEQQLRGVAAMTVGRVEGAVNPEAIALPGLDRGDVAVPHMSVELGQLDPSLGSVVGDEADLDFVGNFGEQGEVDAAAVERGTQGVGMARPEGVHEVLVAVGDLSLIHI